MGGKQYHKLPLKRLWYDLSMKVTATTKTPHHKRRIWLTITLVVVGLIIAVLLWFRLSPWPGAMIIRFVFESNGAKISQALDKHTPPVAVTSFSNESYRPNDSQARLDVYLPQAAVGSQAKFPVVIWTHGGAWISGDKDNAAGYYKLLAAEGYTVVAVDYSVAPEKQYPTAIFQLNDAHAYVAANADRFQADMSKVFLAGDSAGAQLSSQMAALITNPTYAQDLPISPNLTPTQLRGVVLNCGIYKMDGLIHPDPSLPKLVGWGNDVSVWAYLGTHDFSSPLLRQMSAYYHATKDFPATFITGGNADPLTDAQSKPFADRLTSLGITVDRLFYESNHQPPLPHEYQFNLDNTEGQTALTAILTFLKSRS